MRCLYLAPTGQLGVVDDPRLDSTSERHKIDLHPQPSDWQGHPLTALDRDSRLKGFIMEMYHGWVGRDRLWLARLALAHDRRVWVYWPAESAVECIDRERLRSLWRHWRFITTWRYTSRVPAAWRRLKSRVQADTQRARVTLRNVPLWRLPAHVTRKVTRAVIARASGPPSTQDFRLRSSTARLANLDRLIAEASSVPFPPALLQAGCVRLPGCGAYLRTDFWAKIESGGSYGHTCYVAKELAAVTGGLVCFMAHRFRLLDEHGIRQVVIEPPSTTASEDDIVNATTHYIRLLMPAFAALQPTYIYERLCLGNYVGAVLSRAFGIPYIVEYNGSEISMRRSFDGTGYVYEYEYLKAEELAFKQATMISVISAEVKVSLVARGVDPNKILVNPNGADLTAYAPPSCEEKTRIRTELGLREAPVIGFTGTFGGWHGVDVLAAAIPRICELAPDVQFLLIGDGNYKHLVDEQVARHSLQSRVRSVGRVPQMEGARYLKACDIFVSPHNSHMVDSPFFGSPTKVFEYMAMGGGIVASDLEQIGQILSPALSVWDLAGPSTVVTDERAVLCTPGDVDEFVQAVVALVERPDLWPVLGRNARAAVEQHYSWTKHVAHLLSFMAGERSAEESVADLRRKSPSRPVIREPAVVGAGPAGSAASQLTQSLAASEPGVVTDDRYKDEVQRQWDNDPAGSHYVKAAQPHTLEWFLEAEAYRYQEYAPWMRETMEFERHSGEQILEIGGGMGTDLAQFAKHGACVTDLDLSAGHLALAEENFRLRRLAGKFVLQDAEALTFDDNTFDLVYSNGVLHHTPNTRKVVSEIYRVLKPGGRAIVMMYAENSLHYWRNLVYAIGLAQGQIREHSMAELMSRSVERSDNAAARPLVKVYTRARLRRLFDQFVDIRIVQRQMVAAEVPASLRWVPLTSLGRTMGWNLIIKARKPAHEF